VADSCLHILNTNLKLSSLEKCELLLTSIHNLNYEDNFISLTNLLLEEASKGQSYYYSFYSYYEKGQYHIIHTGNTQEGLGLLFKSLEIAKSNQMNLEEGFATYGISRAFVHTKNLLSAERYLKIAIKKFSSNENKVYLSGALMELANLKIKLNQTDSALSIFEETKNHLNSVINPQAQAYLLGNIGQIQMTKNQPDSARKNLRNAITILEQLQDYQALIPYYTYASENELLSDNDPLALYFAQKAYQTTEALNNPERKRDAYEQLVKVHEAMGNYQQAYDYQNKYLHLRDSLINIETVTQMANMRADFEIEQKELEVTQMAEAKTLMTRIAILAGISLFMVGILLLIVYRDARRKKTLNKALLEKQEALSESKKALEKASASKDRLFSIISHDLRGPMGTLSGLSQLLTEMLHNNQVAEAGELNDSISDTIRQIEFLLNNLLHWSINQQNIYEPRNETFDLIKLTQDILRMYDQTAKAKQINLALESPFERLKVQSDSNSWGTIIRNLINNALKFTHPNGFVIVKFSLSKNKVVLEVVDNGVGMSPQQIDCLFSFTGNQPGWGTNNEKGQGLGLSLVHDFVTISKGRIAVTSEPGKGSLFRVTIPVQIMEKEVMAKAF
jgi:signal transduction histidine kinase